MKYLLDTDICIFLLRGRQDVAQAIDKVGFYNCSISEMTKAELLMGCHLARSKGRKCDDRLFDFLDSINIIPVSPAIELFAQETVRLRLDGETIDDMDLLIACTAVANGLTMVTNNTKHLGKVRNVKLENWVDG